MYLLLFCIEEAPRESLPQKSALMRLAVPCLEQVVSYLPPSERETSSLPEDLQKVVSQYKYWRDLTEDEQQNCLQRTNIVISLTDLLKIKTDTLGDSGKHELIIDIDQQALDENRTLQRLDVFALLKRFTFINTDGSLKCIGIEALKDCLGLKSVVIGEGVEVGERAFWYCTGIELLTIGKGAKVGKYAFWGCTGIKSVTIGENAKVCNGAFANCIGIKLVVIKEGVKVGNAAFLDCKDIELVVIEEGSNVSEGAFYGCTSIISARRAPSAVMFPNSGLPLDNDNRA